jgi:hypothetical protein
MLVDLIALDNSARVWVYQGDRELEDDELIEAREHIFGFMDQWTAHNQKLLTYGNIFHRRFLCLFVDESLAGASGCSIDSSVHFIEQLGNALKIDFFDRSNVCFLDNEENIHSIPLAEVNSAFQTGVVKSDTFFFDNLVKTKADFLTKWTTPLNQSWISRFLD